MSIVRSVNITTSLVTNITAGNRYDVRDYLGSPCIRDDANSPISLLWMRRQRDRVSSDRLDFTETTI